MMDLAMNFDADECLVTAMFDKGNRTAGFGSLFREKICKAGKGRNKEICVEIFKGFSVEIKSTKAE